MKNGLKGVTDATVFCKSMQKGGPAPMIRSMKSYAEGGMTQMGLSTESSSAGPIKRKIKRAVQRVKNACKGNGGSGSTFRKNCAGGNWD